MLEMIIAIAVLLGESLLNKAGRNRIGKHTWRAMAAFLMGEVGVDVYKNKDDGQMELQRRHPLYA